MILVIERYRLDVAEYRVFPLRLGRSAGLVFAWGRRCYLVGFAW